MDGGQIVGPDDGVGREVPVPGAHRGGIERELQSLRTRAGPRFSAGSFDREGDLGRDHARQPDVVVARRGRHRVIHHELADHPAETGERHKRQRGDAFGGEHRQEVRQRRIEADIRDDDRIRIRGVGAPRRVPLDGASIFVGQAAMGLEPHDPVGIEQQNGGAVDAQAVAKCPNRGFVDGFDRATPGDGAGQVETHGKMVRGGRRHAIDRPRYHGRFHLCKGRDVGGGPRWRGSCCGEVSRPFARPQEATCRRCPTASPRPFQGP